MWSSFLVLVVAPWSRAREVRVPQSDRAGANADACGARSRSGGRSERGPTQAEHTAGRLAAAAGSGAARRCHGEATTHNRCGAPHDGRSAPHRCTFPSPPPATTALRRGGCAGLAGNAHVLGSAARRVCWARRHRARAGLAGRRACWARREARVLSSPARRVCWARREARVLSSLARRACWARRHRASAPPGGAPTRTASPACLRQDHQSRRQAVRKSRRAGCGYLRLPGD